MELTNLLTTLHELQDKNEKRSDLYLDAMKEYIKSEAGSEWSKRHQVIFKTMQSQIHDARIYRWIIVVLIILVVGSMLYFSINSAWFSTRIKQNTALVELARQSTLPLEIVRLDSTGKWLNVIIANQFTDLSSEHEKYLQDLVGTFPSLGRIYGLSEKNDLTVTLTPSNLDKEPILLVKPDNSPVIIGRLELGSQMGKIWPRSGDNSIDALQQFHLMKPIEFINESGVGLNYYIRINSFDMNTNRWAVQFKEKDKEWSKVYNRTKTLKGAIESSIFIVYEPGWENLYAVTLGIDSYGSDGDKEYAWFVKSFVKRINFK